MQVVLSEYGPDLSRFPTEKNFASHALLAPHKPTSGGKPIKKRKRKGASSRTAEVLRMAAHPSVLPKRPWVRSIEESHGGWGPM